jgi:hypothetical protein
MGQWRGRWRTWSPSFVWAVTFWFGGTLVWTGLALFAGPHHGAFWLLLAVLWAGALTLAVQLIVSMRRQSRGAAWPGHGSLDGPHNGHTS